MKKITVSDILNLDIMKSGRLVAGENGLSNEIRYVSVYDNIPTELDAKIQVFEGDIYLTFCSYGKGNEEYVLNLVKMIISFGAAALIIFDENIQALPPSAEKLCDETGLPVIFMDCQIPYSLIISSIIEYRLAANLKKTIEDKLNAIVSSRTSPEEKHEFIEDLNPSFQKNAVALFCMEKDLLTNMASPSPESINLLNAFNRNTLNFAAEYRDGILLVLTFSDARRPLLDKILSDAVDVVRRYIPRAQIGISNICNIADLGTSVSQCHMAVSAGAADSHGLSYYNQLGISRILLELQGNTALEEFYADIMNPICKTDQESSSNLFETMLCFVENEMDYKKTCQTMFVHENTIRYRINKIKALIPYGKSDMDFYETISVAVKIYKMKNF